jgi:hypothetical protein
LGDADGSAPRARSDAGIASTIATASAAPRRDVNIEVIVNSARFPVLVRGGIRMVHAGSEKIRPRAPRRESLGPQASLWLGRLGRRTQKFERMN